MKKPAKIPIASAEEVRSWTCHQFRMTDSESRIPHLLHKVADSIEQLGSVDILDITFCSKFQDLDSVATIVVYFSFTEDDEDIDKDRDE